MSAREEVLRLRGSTYEATPYSKTHLRQTLDRLDELAENGLENASFEKRSEDWLVQRARRFEQIRALAHSVKRRADRELKRIESELKKRIGS